MTAVYQHNGCVMVMIVAATCLMSSIAVSDIFPFIKVHTVCEERLLEVKKSLNLYQQN